MKKFILHLSSYILLFLLSGCSIGTAQPTVSVSNVPLPVTGIDGQITVVAPTANPANFSGTFFYIKENAIWQSVAPLNKDKLGGMLVLKVKDLEVVKNPAFSPDGTTLAYTFSPEPVTDPVRGSVVIQQINLYDLNSKQIKKIIKAPQNDTLLDEAAWSKDGNYLFYGMRQPLRDKENVVIGQKLDIRRYEVATGKDELLVEDGISPAPTADGKSLVYIGKDATGQTLAPSLRIIDLNSRNIKTLLGQEQNFLAYFIARPSPDGAWVVFSAPIQIPLSPEATPKPKTGIGGAGSVKLLSPPKHAIPYDIYVVRTDGTGLRRLTTLFEDQPQPLWSKDGKTIIFLAGHGLYTVDIATATLSKKVNEGAYGGFDYTDK
jgi:tricorn protease-like protein